MKAASPWEQRRPERELLLICLGGIGLGVILVMGSLHGVGRPLGLVNLLPFLLYALSLAGLHLALVMAGFRGDQILVVAPAAAHRGRWGRRWWPHSRPVPPAPRP
ncbi:MAG TPA: hypothetical protein VLQ88_01890, partial [Chromatiaceae bacterium]|nr:hypothetical protein [Chromatiaceae bacterium]